jgi:hypothetical protein
MHFHQIVENKEICNNENDSISIQVCVTLIQQDGGVTFQLRSDRLMD